MINRENVHIVKLVMPFILLFTFTSLEKLCHKGFSHEVLTKEILMNQPVEFSKRVENQHMNRT